MQKSVTKQPTTFTLKAIINSLLVLSLSTVTLVGCTKNADDHKEHDHKEHSHDEHGHENEHNDEHHDEAESDHHDHHDHHAHHEVKEQVIPEGYSVNFAVSNYPMYLLSEAVTKNTKTTVYRLLGAGDVGHHGSLSPSDLKKATESKSIVWFGEELESNLTNTLHKDEYKDKTVTILDNKNINILDHRNEKATVVAGKLDPHVWLDPDNAKAIVKILADVHASANPQLAETYKKNTEQFITDLDALTAKYAHKTSHKYWSSHDAFQYLEKSLNLQLAGALTTDHEVPTKASQILWLTKNRPYETMCLLSQGVQKEGLLSKIQPVVTQVLIEDLSDSESFLEAWEKSAKAVTECVAKSTVKES